MPWAETAPGRFERDFDSLENFYRSIAAAGAPIAREHFQIHAIAKISPLPTEADLRRAWTTLRWRHPLLAADEQDGRYVYKLPESDAALQAWARETCLYHAATEGVTVESLLRLPKPAGLIVLHALEATGELVVRTSHWRMDGIGSMGLVDSLLDALANPTPESSLVWSAADTLPRLTPGVDEAVAAPVEDTAERQSKAKAMMDIVTGNPATMAFATLPEQMPGPTGRLRHTLSEADTRRVVAGCKASGMTVSLGVHAALIAAGQALDATRAKTAAGDYVYTDLITVSLRRYLPPPLDWRRVPVTVYHTGVPLTVRLDEAQSDKGSTTTAAIAAQLARTYRADHRAMFDYLRQWVDTIVAFYATPPSPDGPPPPALPSLSSLGIVEENVDMTHSGSAASPYRLLDWSCTVEVIDRHVFGHLWTIGGRLNLQLLWNEAFYPRDFVDRLMAAWTAALLQLSLDK